MDCHGVSGRGFCIGLGTVKNLCAFYRPRLRPASPKATVRTVLYSISATAAVLRATALPTFANPDEARSLRRTKCGHHSEGDPERLELLAQRADAAP